MEFPMHFTFDQLGTFVAAGVTNFCCFPALYVIWKRGLLLNAYVGTFTFVMSLIYHCTDALGIKGFYLTPSGWHRLDNIGSIMSMITLLIHLMDNLHRNSLGELESRHEARIDRHLTYCAMMLTLIMQTNDPWNIINTIIPVLLYLVILVVKSIRHPPRLNIPMFRKGLLLMALAVFFFSLGLHDDQDYLRIFHGLWHFVASVSLFYLMQCVDKDRPDPKLQLAKLAKMERFGYWQVVRHLLTLQFLQPKPTKSV